MQQPEQNIPPNGPVEQDQLPVDGQGGPDLGRPDPLFELLEELGVADGGLEGCIHANLGYHAA